VEQGRDREGHQHVHQAAWSTPAAERFWFLQRSALVQHSLAEIRLHPREGSVTLVHPRADSARVHETTSSGSPLSVQANGLAVSL